MRTLPVPVSLLIATLVLFGADAPPVANAQTADRVDEEVPHADSFRAALAGCRRGRAEPCRRIAHGIQTGFAHPLGATEVEALWPELERLMATRCSEEELASACIVVAAARIEQRLPVDAASSAAVQVRAGCDEGDSYQCMLAVLADAFSGRADAAQQRAFATCDAGDPFACEQQLGAMVVYAPDPTAAATARSAILDRCFLEASGPTCSGAMQIWHGIGAGTEAERDALFDRLAQAACLHDLNTFGCGWTTEARLLAAESEEEERAALDVLRRLCATGETSFCATTIAYASDLDVDVSGDLDAWVEAACAASSTPDVCEDVRDEAAAYHSGRAGASTP